MHSNRTPIGVGLECDKSVGRTLESPETLTLHFTPCFGQNVSSPSGDTVDLDSSGVAPRLTGAEIQARLRTHPSTAVRESKVTVKIPRPLYRRIQQVVEGSGFNSPTDFVVYVLRDLIGENDADTHDFTQEELDEVKRKLKNLGYL
ncbi:MAG: Arc/MetJ-type ribon-helix-helix transcriptional regulator [Planctomycetota bacterium]